MIRPEERKGLVRGKIAVAFGRCGFLSLDQKELDERDCRAVIAFTNWHRHDEDPQELQKELNELCMAYRKFRGYSGMMVGYEYKDYKQI